jgi:hypothetical protein
MEKLNLEQMENIQGGKFWGDEIVHHNLGGCTWTCKQKYMFWFKVGDEYACTVPDCGGPQM